MKQSTLDNIERIVDYMQKTSISKWPDVISSLGRERESYCEAISKAFRDLIVIGFEISEAKYIGYGELIDNKDKPELLDTIMKKHAQIIKEKENKRKEIGDRISELMFFMEDLRDRVMEFSILPQSVPVDEKQEDAQGKECA